MDLCKRNQQARLGATALACVLGLVVARPSIARNQTQTCADSAVENLLPDVVGPMMGASPFWLVDGGAKFRGEAHPVKTLWVLRRTSESIRITGRRLDAPGVITVRQGQEPPSEALEIRDPPRASVIPGRASADVMRDYVFLTSHVFYPSAGCWEFTLQAGASVAHIVRHVVAGEPAAARPAVLRPPR